MKLKANDNIRIAIVTNRIPIYRFPIFKSLQECPWFDLCIFVSMPVSASAPEAQRELKIRYSRGLNMRIHTRRRTRNTRQVELPQLPVKLPFDLLSYRPDVIISGEFGPRSLCAYLVARIRGIPFVLWSEEIAETAANIGVAQRLLRKILLPKANAFLAWGKPAVNYLKSRNIPDKNIYYCAQAVNNHYWKSQHDQYDKSTLRHQYKVIGKVFILVGRLIPLKGIDLFLNAWAGLSSEVQRNNSVLIVGNGEQEQFLRKMVSKMGIPNVRFVGYKTMDELPKYYSVADVFVFPTLGDVWGLVINEALASGLPVLSSKYAGASQDLVEKSGCGEIFDPMDIGKFTDILKHWCLNDTTVSAEDCQAAVGPFNFDASVKAITMLLQALYPSLDIDRKK